MRVRTYFWNDRIVSLPHYLYQTYIKSNKNYFRKGNAGDIYASYLVKYLYGLEANNIKDEGNRLLFIGSISHLVKDNDLLCGVGTKGEEFRNKDAKDTNVWALRGPISYDFFKNAGFDVSNIKFLLDPGLMIKYTIDQSFFEQEKVDVAFIPHYREKAFYQSNLPKDIKLIDIDDCPHNVGKNILKSKLVYSSSLHGIIFSHALGVPCIFVKPQTEEPLIKFKDYYHSVDLAFPKPLENIGEIDFKKDSDTPADIKIKREDFVFPTLDFLKQQKYCR